MTVTNDNTTPAVEQERTSYFLVAGEIVFQTNGEELPTAIRSNAVVMSKTGKFAVPQIAMAQQALQHVFHSRMGPDAPVNVLDVVIMSLMPLGEFTPEEFNKVPQGFPAAVQSGDGAFPVTDVPVEEAEKLA